MGDLRQFVEDCKVYHRAMDRMKTLGIHDEQKAIVYLQREIDQYRDKIRSMEELMAFLDGKYKHAITIKCDGKIIEECVRRLKNDR